VSKEIVEAILRVEEWNDQFRKANPNGKYPVCKPITGGGLPLRCERCREIAIYDRPCPAVPPKERWGPDYTPGGEGGEDA
jgi:hypothetical protein